MSAPLRKQPAPALRAAATDVPNLEERADAEQRRMSEAFSDLEDDICDLPRAALLAVQQLYRAVGELRLEGGKYVEVPCVDDTELAIFAVDQLLKMTRDLMARWYRLHNEAGAAGTKSHSN